MKTTEKLGQEPAFPQPPLKASGETIFVDGMSKRFYAACAAMQGILANKYPDIVGLTTEQLIGVSYECADEILEQE